VLQKKRDASVLPKKTSRRLGVARGNIKKSRRLGVAKKNPRNASVLLKKTRRLGVAK
jgi:hypothetical protein